MSDQESEIRRLVTEFERAVESVYPAFEHCDPQTYAHRLDITMRASVALMAAGCAACLRFKMPESPQALFDTIFGHIVELTKMNLEHGTVTNRPEMAKKDTVH